MVKCVFEQFAIVVILLTALLFSESMGRGAAGFIWDDITWYYSDYTNPLFENSFGQFEWDPAKGQQINARIPDQRLSQVGDVAQFQYYFMTDGANNCPDCFSCDLYCLDDDITCIAGTSDIRIGLFDADGEYIENDGFDVTSSSVFEGYKGYIFRFGPNMLKEPTRWVDCTGEVHKTGQFCKKPVSLSNLMYTNDGLMEALYGLEATPGEFSLMTLKLERLSSSSVRMTISYNGKSYSYTDNSSTDQPQLIDVIAIHMRNGRPYNRLVLAKEMPSEPPTADFSGNLVVDETDLLMFSYDWLDEGTYQPIGSKPDANGLLVYYPFDETYGNVADDLSGNDFDGLVLRISDEMPITTAWNTDGYDDLGCINFDGTNMVDVPQMAFNGIDSAVTVSLWINGDAAVQPDGNWGMPFHAGSSSNDRLLHTHIPTKDGDVMFESGAYNVQRLIWTDSTPGDWEGQWNHYVFTLDTLQGEVKIFHNGENVKQGDCSLGAAAIEWFTIGCGIFDSGTVYEYFGKIDDFKIYDYALTEDEVLYLANDGVAYSIPDSPTNLYEDGVIDAKDFAEFASQWRDSCE